MKPEKKTKEPTPAPNQPTGAAAAHKPKKVKAPKVLVPLTPAQQKAQEMLDKANTEAREELIKNSGSKIIDAEKKIADAKAAFIAAKAELKAIKRAVGIKGTFGGKKANTLFFVQPYPEGKGAPQARQILEIVKAGGKEGVVREKVVETMKTVINTKMDRSRLLSFYCSRMVESGVICVE